MRKVKFIGNAGDYRWDIKPVKGQLYDEDYRGSYNGKQYEPLNWVGEGEREVWVDDPEDWELVEDGEEEPETDLEYVVRLYDNMSDKNKILFNRMIGNYD